MYEYNQNNNEEEPKQVNSGYSQQTVDQSIISRSFEQERQKLREKAEKKASRKKFWKKIGIGLGVGIAFGITAGICFAGVVRVIDLVFPRTTVESRIVEEKKQEEHKEIGIGQSDKEEKPEVKSEKKVDKESSYVKKDAEPGMGVSNLVKESMPSIVSITNKSVQEVRSMFGMGVREYESTSAGSGIIIGMDEEELLVATNNHVIEGASSITVGFVDDEVYTAYVKGGDSDIDLAVVAVKLDDISDSTKDAIKVASIGDSQTLEVGEQVVAIGNALGYGQSVTTGIVSALERDITDDDVDNPLIQTDAAINPGNSGGALFNMEGELVGINCAKIASTSIEGVGYAIPISEATPIIERLMNRHTREKVDAKEAGYIGISGVSVDSATSKSYGIPQGVYIQNVEEGSPAEEAGLLKSDVIRKFDGVTVSTISEIKENLDYYKVGETVDLVIYRQVDGEYQEKTISIVLGDRKGTSLDPDKIEKKDDDNSNNYDNGEEIEDDGDFYFNYGGDFDDFFNFFP